MKTIQKIISYDYQNEKIECPLWTQEDFNLNINDSYPIQTAIAYKLNNDLKNGFYIEIGAGHYKDGNNTYYLEKEYGWKGVSLDKSQVLVERFNTNRNNLCLFGDALTFNWKSYFEENNVPKEIDYLSIDVDFYSHKWANLLAFLNLPIHEYKFKIISIEHMAAHNYEFERLKTIQREILSSIGYYLIFRGECEDIWSIEEPNSLNGMDQLVVWKNLGL